MRPFIFICLLLGINTAFSQPTKDTVSRKPTSSELAWLKSVTVPLNSVEMNSDDSDLLPLDTMIIGKSVIALGEVSHGSGDIYKMKSKIIKHLITHDSFTVFAIEANMPEAYSLNNYILYGNGDPKELIKGMLFWTWDTREMCSLVEWMKSYNSTHSRKVTFTGFDMQAYRGPFKELTKLFEKYNHDTLFTLTELGARLAHDDSVRKVDYLDAGMKVLKKHKKYYLSQFDLLGYFADQHISLKYDHDFFIQYIRLLKQYTQCFSSELRDKFMAENFMWIKAQNDPAKIVIWAHNGHIIKSSLFSQYRMGYYLSDKLNDNYLALGFTYNVGTYTALGKEGLKAYSAQKSYPGTYEYYFHSIGQPIFLLDLRNIPSKNPDAQWLLKEQLFRWTGAVPMDQEFLASTIRDGFDLLVYIDSTSPCILLHERALKK